jgi:iron complex transport system permease protein
MSRHLNVLMLGEEMAGHVGLEAERTKTIALGLAAVMTAAAVSASGLISFVGLTIPHATRALVGPDHRRLLPAAALMGAAFLVLADGFGRTLLYPTEIPVGVITALIGGPFFLVILRTRRKEVWIG